MMVKVGISVMISANLADQYFEMIQFSSTQVILVHLNFYGVLDCLASVIANWSIEIRKEIRTAAHASSKGGVFRLNEKMVRRVNHINFKVFMSNISLF